MTVTQAHIVGLHCFTDVYKLIMYCRATLYDCPWPPYHPHTARISTNDLAFPFPRHHSVQHNHILASESLSSLLVVTCVLCWASKYAACRHRLLGHCRTCIPSPKPLDEAHCPRCRVSHHLSASSILWSLHRRCHSLSRIRVIGGTGSLNAVCSQKRKRADH
jgi:hypothetical protein